MPRCAFSPRTSSREPRFSAEEGESAQLNHRGFARHGTEARFLAGCPGCRFATLPDMQVYFFLAGSARSLERQPGWMGRGGTRPSKPCNGGPRLSGPWFNVGLSILVPRARQACPSDLPEGPACQVRLSRRDPLVGSDEHRLMTHPSSPGTTSVPLRSSGGTCLSGPFFPEGPACRVRRATLDHPFPVPGD